MITENTRITPKFNTINTKLKALSIFQSITDDDVDRITLCLRVLANRTALMKDIFTVECRLALSNMLESNKQDNEESSKVL